MIKKIIYIEPWTASDFILTFSNTEQRMINLKNVLENLKLKNNEFVDLSITEDKVSAFHLNIDGDIEWSFGDFKIDSSKAYELSELCLIPDARNVPALLSGFMCISEQDVLAAIGITEEEFELWKIDTSSSAMITNLMLFAFNNVSLLSSLSELKEDLLRNSVKEIREELLRNLIKVPSCQQLSEDSTIH